MRKTLTDLLAADQLAQRFGCGLNPDLRRAIEADTCFPVVAASSPAVQATGGDALRGNMVALQDPDPTVKHRSARNPRRSV